MGGGGTGLGVCGFVSCARIEPAIRPQARRKRVRFIWHRWTKVEWKPGKAGRSLQQSRFAAQKSVSLRRLRESGACGEPVEEQDGKLLHSAPVGFVWN